MDVKPHVYKLMSSIQVDGLVRDAVSQGAKVRLGGQQDAKGGNFYQPTLLTDVTTKMRCSSEEIFGPVATIIKCVHTTTSLSLFVLWSDLLCRTLWQGVSGWSGHCKDVHVSCSGQTDSLSLWASWF